MQKKKLKLTGHIYTETLYTAVEVNLIPKLNHVE